MRLHKVASNSKQVMEAFPVEDRAKDLKDLDLGVDPVPLQRSLCLFRNGQLYLPGVLRKEAVHSKRCVVNGQQLVRPFGLCSSDNNARESTSTGVVI